MKDQFLQLQEQLTEYFKDFDNKTLIKFIESFTFHLPAKDDETSKLITKFLKDNELETAYVNYLSDFVVKGNSTASFLSSSLSQRGMIDQIKQALNILAFNRFRNMDFPKLVQPSKIKFDGTGEVKKDTVCIVDNFRGEYTLCGTQIDSDYAGKHTATDDASNCELCASVVNYCKGLAVISKAKK